MTTNIYTWMASWFETFGIAIWILDIVLLFILTVIIATTLIVVVMFLVWMERKVSAHMQQRYGPMWVGRHGSLQLIADAIKLVAKEDLIPNAADKIVFWLAPILAFTAAFLAYLVIPIDGNLIVADLNIGILYILAVTSLTVIAIIMAGIGSNSKWTILGAMRSAAQIISYEVPLILSILGVIMITGSLSMISIVKAQENFWFILLQPLGFIIYLIAAVAETNRTPFDIPEAESELVAGYNTEYSGIKFAMLFFAEYVNVFTVSAIATTLFLGGWMGPFLAGPIWFLIKTLIMVFIIMWFRWTYPRLRIDQLMGFAWKVLLPLSFINIAITGLVLLYV
ncbi:MAG: NADH-quinone oxidoreductase subunit NuoH [bacterium]